MPLKLESGQSVVCLGKDGTDVVVYNKWGHFVGKLSTPPGLSVDNGTLARFITAEAARYELTVRAQHGAHCAFDLK